MYMSNKMKTRGSSTKPASSSKPKDKPKGGKPKAR
jgi:hypothetical protein